MDRNDWVFAGTRLGGLFLVCRSTLGVPGVLEFYHEAQLEGGVFYKLSASGIAEVVLGWSLGVLLFFGAPAIELWLKRKDGRLGPVDRME